MKKAVAFIFSLSFFTLHPYGQQPDKMDRLRSLIESVNIPGIQLVYSKDGHPSVYNTGTIAGGSNVPVTSATIFEAASLSKAVFAYTVLRLVDKGVLALDTPLLHYIGGTYERFDPANPLYEKITARLVLSHRTGFRNWADPGIIPLLFPPDSCFNYSGEANMFLMDVVEKITHKNLEQLAQEETFRPLGMKNSSFLWDAKFAAASTFGSDSNAIRHHNTIYAASSLLTNAHDYTIFMEAVMSGKGLRPETHRQMLSRQSAGNWFNHPVIPATEHIGWGLGVGIQQNEKGKAHWQWGDNGDFKAFYIFFPDRRESLVYFTHSARGLYIAQQVVDVFMGKQTTWAIPFVQNGYPTPYDIGYAKPYALNRFREQLEKQGFRNAQAVWNREKKRDRSFTIPEEDLRTLGIILMERQQVKGAVEVLKWNATVYPDNAAALQSLGEAWHAAGNDLQARNYLKKCLSLDPKNTVATELLKKLATQ